MDTPDDDRRPFALVVDDDTLILMDASGILEDAGFRPLEATDVDAAEIILVEYADEIVLLFTDVQMPGTMDGLKLAHFIRDRWPPVKLMVASGATILEESSLPAGSSFFSKPYDDSKITDAMARLLASDAPSGPAGS